MNLREAGLWLIAAAIVLGLGVWIWSEVKPETGRLRAEEAVREWVKPFELDIEVVQCEETDTDNDHYVSCTIRSSGWLVPIECAKEWWSVKGCRLSRANSVNVSPNKVGCEQPKTSTKSASKREH